MLVMQTGMLPLRTDNGCVPHAPGYFALSYPLSRSHPHVRLLPHNQCHAVALTRIPRPRPPLAHFPLQVPVDVIKEVPKIVEIIKVIEVPIIKEVILGAHAHPLPPDHRSTASPSDRRLEHHSPTSHASPRAALPRRASQDRGEAGNPDCGEGDH